MDKFSQKSLLALGDYYVYGLVDPRTDQIFYIGKGSGNRVFDHEKQSLNSPNSEVDKIKTISDIKNQELDVKKIIILWNLDEKEAFAAEAALINALNFIYKPGLTNIVAGHHSAGALTVEEFEKIYGADGLKASDIKHKILVIKINKLYHRNMTGKDLYDAVRGIWVASMTRASKVDYVFGVYNSLIVAVYKPTAWYTCKGNPSKMPAHAKPLPPEKENRIFFVDKNFESGKPMDEDQESYYGKSIADLELNQAAQNPITYLNPQPKS